MNEQDKKIMWARLYLEERIENDFYLGILFNDIYQEYEKQGGDGENDKLIQEVLEKKLKGKLYDIYKMERAKKEVRSIVKRAGEIEWIRPQIDGTGERKVNSGEVIISDYRGTQSEKVSAYKIEHGQIWLKHKGKKKYRSYPPLYNNRFLFDPDTSKLFIIL